MRQSCRAFNAAFLVAHEMVEETGIAPEIAAKPDPYSAVM